MRIFFASLATETNTFSPIPTGLADYHCVRPDEPVTGSFGRTVDALRRRLGPEDTLIRGLIAHAQPAGITARSAYESLRDELLEDLRQAGPVDVVLLLLHGAMVAEAYEDCELDLVSRARAIVGAEVAIGVELDLHCHIDERLTALADVVLTYKEYPHVDVAARLLELHALCAATREGTIRPVSAVHDCHMVGMFSTLDGPMRDFVQEMKQAETRDGILSVSFAHGFPWGDVPHAGAKLIVVADGDMELAARTAQELGERIYALRHEAGIHTLPMEQALSRALSSSARPVVLPDMSDNAGGGAPADSTFVLQWLLEHGVRGAGIAFLYDPEAVRIVKAAGVGASLPLRVGGKTGPSSGQPVDLQVRVLGIRDNYIHDFPQDDGEALLFEMGDVAAVESRGIHILLASRRSQCFSYSAFRDFGLGELDFYIPKSTNHFKAGFRDIAADIIHMATPGAIVPDFARIPYRHMPTADKFPWCESAGAVSA